MKSLKPCFSGCPEATAKSVLEMAKAAVQQDGGGACVVTDRLARASTDRAETVCHQLPLARDEVAFYLTDLSFASDACCHEVSQARARA